MRPPRLGSMSPGAALWPWILGLRLACVHRGANGLYRTATAGVTKITSRTGDAGQSGEAKEMVEEENYTTEHQCEAKEGQGIHLFGLIQSLWLLVSHRLPAQDLLDRTQQPL